MDRDSWVRAQIQLIPSSIKSFDHILSHVCECHHFHLMDAIIVFDILSCTSKFALITMQKFHRDFDRLSD